MKTSRVTSAVLLITLLAIAIVYVFYQYNKPRKTAAERQAIHKTDATALYREFAASESGASAIYGNTIIEVSGLVAELDSSSENISILLAAGGLGYINCSMLSLDRPVYIDQPIVIKGKCTGFMLDVLLVDCIIQ